MLKECIKEGMRLHMYDLFPKAGEGIFRTMPEMEKEKILREGEKYLGYEYPSLPMTLYMEYTRTRNRTHYQNRAFQRKSALTSLVLAESVEGKGRFLDDIMNGIFAICEETSWTIPAHNTYIRDKMALPLPIKERPILDLFSCETGAVLAVTHFLLSKRLSGIFEEIPKRIENELEKRILEPYFSAFFWWMGNGLEPTNNWTVWCTKNVLLTAFMLPWKDEVREKVLMQAVRSIDCFIEEYGDDGCCPEGASYYHHAALCMFECLDILNTVTDNAFAAVYENEKIRNMVNYIMKVHVAGEYYLNYADCDLRQLPAGTREFLAAKKTGQEDMMAFAADQYRLKCERYPEETTRDLYDRLRELLLREETLSFRKPEPPETKESAGFIKKASFPSVGVDIADDGDFFLSVKSGDNTGSHKHNDTGSFILFSGGEPMFIDPGVESYTQKTFSEERYEIWTMQSSYHNLPEFSGHQQMGKLQHVPGLYAAENTEVSIESLPFGKEVFRERMELRNTYDDKAPVSSCIREYEFVSGGDIVIKDTVKFTEGADWNLNFMTCLKPFRDQEKSGLIIGSLGMMEFSTPVKIETEEIPITDERLKKTWNGAIYRTKVFPEGNEITCRIKRL